MKAWPIDPLLAEDVSTEVSEKLQTNLVVTYSAGYGCASRARQLPITPFDESRQRPPNCGDPLESSEVPSLSGQPGDGRFVKAGTVTTL